MSFALKLDPKTVPTPMLPANGSFNGSLANQKATRIKLLMYTQTFFLFARVARFCCDRKFLRAAVTNHCQQLTLPTGSQLIFLTVAFNQTSLILYSI